MRLSDKGAFFLNKLNFSVLIFPQEWSCMTKESCKDMEFRCKHLFTFRSVTPRKHIIEHEESESKLKQAKSKQTVIYHKLLSCINLFGQSAISFYYFSYLPIGCQWMLSFQKQLNYLLEKLASFSIYLLSSFVCRNECSFSLGYMQIALYFCFRRYNNSGAKTFQVNMSLICMKMRRSRNTFSYDWFHMKMYLNTEAKNNFQMMDIEGANLQWL